jgi:hypothetical protein
MHSPLHFINNNSMELAADADSLQEIIMEQLRPAGSSLLEEAENDRNQ